MNNGRWQRKETNLFRASYAVTFQCTQLKAVLGELILARTRHELDNCQCQAKFLTSRHVHMHRMVFYIANTPRKLMIRAQGLVFR